ncbi:MAG: hypothetical protein AVDCRST_MAG29-2321 [uncultured Nocardioidaceae bacterium]|uniref:Uncharacterized protein n=1 Tax=uncultured Nocardioidaceae bacterium TaxID=253824 RepID=A0A6J4M7X0_9ACTN|nr:MAG: hypothetical protein AVDCRST_MAG29-2321 [uncultured Nocardioidaceae bacterium]
MSKFTLTAAGAVGYVLGARAGRGRYEQIAAFSRRVWNDPRVQRATADMQDKATETVRKAAPVVGAKVRSTVSDAATMTGSADDPVPPAGVTVTEVAPPVAVDQVPAANAGVAPAGVADETIGGPA